MLHNDTNPCIHITTWGGLSIVCSSNRYLGPLQGPILLGWFSDCAMYVGQHNNPLVIWVQILEEILAFCAGFDLVVARQNARWVWRAKTKNPGALHAFVTYVAPKSSIKIASKDFWCLASILRGKDCTGLLASYHVRSNRKIPAPQWY